MANAPWSQLVFDVHVLDTDEVVFIRGKALPQPSGNDLTPIDFGLEAFVQTVIEHCQEAKPSLESHELIDPYNRVVQDNHRFSHILQRLVETPWNSTIWKLRRKAETSSSGSNILVDIGATAPVDFVSASFPVHENSANVLMIDDPDPTTPDNNIAGLHLDEHLPTVRLGDDLAITHIQHGSSITHSTEDAAIAPIGDDASNVPSNNDSSTAYLNVDLAPVSTNSDEAVPATQPPTSPPPASAPTSAPEPPGGHTSPGVARSPQIGLVPYPSSPHDHSGRESPQADAPGEQDSDEAILTPLNVAPPVSFPFTSEAIMPQPEPVENNILDRAAGLTLKDSLARSSAADSASFEHSHTIPESAACSHTRKKVKLEGPAIPPSTKAPPPVDLTDAAEASESTHAPSFTPINSKLTGSEKSTLGDEASGYGAGADARSTSNSDVGGHSPSDAISIVDEESQDPDEEMNLSSTHHTGISGFDRKLALAAIANNFEQKDNTRWENVCRLFLQSTASSSRREFTSVPWLERAPLNYQAYGAYFLMETERSVGGAILADEMGLGKTMTVITALATISMINSLRILHHRCSKTTCELRKDAGPSSASPFCPKATTAPPLMRKAFRNLPTLVVVPARSIDNWVCEFEATVTKRKLDWIRVHGDKGGRPDLQPYMVGPDGKADRKEQPMLYRTVIVTSKESMKRRILDYGIGPQQLETTTPKSLAFARVVVDESHEFRGSSTNFVKGLLQFAGRGAAVWFMSGTPLPKGPESVLMCFKCWDARKETSNADEVKKLVMKFNSTSVKLVQLSRTPAEPIKKVAPGKEKKSVAEKLRVAEDDMETVAAKLSGLLRPHMLQRSAESKFLGQPLMDLPPMTVVDKTFPLRAAWSEKYVAYWNKLQTEQFQQNSSSKRRRDDESDAPKPTVGFAHLRMSRIYSGLPALLDYPNQTWANLDLDEFPKTAKPLFTKSELQTILQSSPKLESLIAECGQLNLPTLSPLHGQSDEKVVVFTKYPVEAYIIHEVLTKLKEFGSCLLLSTTALAARLHLINEVFQGLSTPATADILVTTYGIGGTCHNMIRSRTVILFGPDFMETVEKQAQHRIRRVGQRSPTRSIRYLTDGTIDKLLVLRQQVRSKFDDRVLGVVVSNLKPLHPAESTQFLTGMGSEGGRG